MYIKNLLLFLLFNICLFFANMANAIDVSNLKVPDWVSKFAQVSSVTISNGNSSLDFFASDMVAAELILAANDINISNGGSINDGINLAGALTNSVNLQYNFIPTSLFSPYFGAGINYSNFTTKKSNIDNFDYSLQMGLNYNISDNWKINADISKLYLNSENISDNALESFNSQLTPWVFGLGVAYKY